MAPHPFRRWLEEQAGSRLWPIAVLLTAIAGGATFANASGRYIGDDRLDQFVSPGSRLTRSLSLWDGSRGLGRVREDLWVGLNGPLAVLRGLGLSTWATERAFHTLLIVLGGVGVVALVRAFLPGIGLGHVLGALLYSFGPYSAAFLQPSNLYASYAAAPWLALIAVRGVRSPRRWRWAARFALVVVLLGNADPPGVVLVGLVVIPVIAWSVWVERSARLRWAIGWLVRTAILTAGVSLAVLYKTWVAAATFGNRLDTTETPSIVSAASSWTETFRGLGFWVSYFRGATLARPQTEILSSNPVVVFATLAVPVLALVALWLSPSRARVLFGGTALLAVTVMVGMFPIRHRSPYGATISWVYSRVEVLTAFRTSYKAGGLLVIGTAGLLALGYEELKRRLPVVDETRSVAIAGLFLLVATTAAPFWSGSLYNTNESFRQVPGYWTQAIDYVDALPGSGRILVLPGSTRTRYRWGWVGDDIIDALMHRPHAVDTAVPLSEPLAADLLHRVSESVGDGTYQTGTLAPILRRLGIDRVLIRNDTDWDADQTYRPNALDAVRADPDLTRLRTFGRPGENTTPATDHTAAAAHERRLPPVEVYRLTDPGPIGPRVVGPADRPLLVSGDGSAWPVLSHEGYLSDPGPVRYSATVPVSDLARSIAASRGVVVTDTNRRRVVTVTGFHLDDGPTLGAGQGQDRPAVDLFGRAGSQTVAWFADARRISATGAARGLQGAQPASRPAAAFDGDLDTAWTTFESTHQVGLRLRVDLRHPTVLSRADLTAVSAADGVDHVTLARLRFSDGSSAMVPFNGRAGSVTFRPRKVRWVEVEIAAVSGGAPHQVGFSEVTFGQLDLAEWVQLPDDLVRHASDPAVARALAATPLTYQFQRAATVSGTVVEPELRRRFRVPSTRTFTIRGTMTPPAADTTTLARSLAVGCTGSASLVIGGQRVPLRLVGSPTAFKDGDPLPVVGCNPVTLTAGWHDLTYVGGSLDDLSMRSPGRARPTSRGATHVRVVSEAPGRWSLLVDAPEGGLLLSSQSYERRWSASVDGHPLGAATALDTLSGWDLPRGRALRVTLSYQPQRHFPAVLLVTGLAVLACLALALRPVVSADDPGASTPEAAEDPEVGEAPDDQAPSTSSS